MKLSFIYVFVFHKIQVSQKAVSEIYNIQIITSDIICYQKFSTNENLLNALDQTQNEMVKLS